MVVLDQFYQIVEKNTKRVSFFWKASHILVFCGAGICGFLTTFAFGQILADFDYLCVLNAEVQFSNTTNLTSTKHGGLVVDAIDVTHTIWGSNTDCQFSQFTPLFTMIAAIVWAGFFVILARGGSGSSNDLLTRPWAVVYPCIIFTAIIFIIYAVSTLQLRRGLTAFCSQFASQLGKDGCPVEMEIYATQFNKATKRRLFSNIYKNKNLTVFSSEVGIWMWAIQLCLLIARIVQMADFDLHLITIFPKEEELVERVTNPELEDGEEDETSPV